MTILVTGAAGHLGANLVRALLSRGQRVRALVREGSSRQALEGLDVEVVCGDLRDEQSLRTAVRGVEQLFHTAAMISIRSGDREALMKTNVEGTRALLSAAQDAGVKKVVHTSSFGAIGTRTDRPSNEDDWLDPFEPVMDYERSKAQSEVVVLQAAARGLPVTIVNPSAIVGPFDFGPSLVGRTIVDFGNGKMRAYVPGAFDWVPMKDVVSGHLLAMEKGAPGERYLLSGEVHTLDQIMSWLSEFTGKPVPSFRIPARLMQSIALVKDWVEREFFPEATPRFNYHSIRILSSHKHGNNEKARRELGYQPTPVRDAFSDAVRWFQQTGRIS
jgi:hopanoid-associated sugar epimerase